MAVSVKKNRVLLALVIIQVAQMSLPALLSAALITDLFNTGVDGSGNALADGSDDPHYSLISSPSLGLSDQVVTNNPAWVPNSSTAKWISADVLPNDPNGPPGSYTFRTTFTLPGHADLSSVLVSGSWAVDNSGSDILVNGVSSGQMNSNGFATTTGFNLMNNFVVGTNTLDFVIVNSGVTSNPVGLLVSSISGTYSVPEPGSMALTACGLLTIVGTCFRRRSGTLARTPVAGSDEMPAG